MGEEFLNKLAPEIFEAESAGLEPGNLNPFVVKVMQEEGVDMSANLTKSVQSMLNAGKTYDYVIAVCDAEAAERCPVFPGEAERMHWFFPDPSSFQGTDEEKLDFARNVRDMIKTKLTEWIESF